jgi:uncharacterized Zn ribbon protein
MPPLKLNPLPLIGVGLGVTMALKYYQTKNTLKAVTIACALIWQENEQLREKGKYLLHVIDEHDIELSDFDLIVLTHDLPVDD